METKVCISCKVEKSIEEFKTVKNHGKLVKMGKCALCYREKDALQHRLKTRKKNSFPDLDGELWRPIPGYDRYEVSNKGRIKNIIAGNLLVPQINADGYYKVKLTYAPYKYKEMALHRAVALAWIANPLQYKEINHKLGIKELNTVDDLEWCNRSFNVTHAFKEGLNKPALGTKNSRTFFTVDQINQIFKMKNDLNYNYSKISRHFNTNHSTIRNIYLRKTWKHLLKDEKGDWYEPE